MSSVTSHEVLKMEPLAAASENNKDQTTVSSPQTGEGQESAADHPHGPSGGRRLHRVLDADSHLCHHYCSGENPQLHPSDHHLALLYRLGIHQQVGAAHLHSLVRTSPNVLLHGKCIFCCNHTHTHEHMLASPPHLLPTAAWTQFFMATWMKTLNVVSESSARRVRPCWRCRTRPGLESSFVSSLSVKPTA